ncbi:DUF3450 domain-containing protein [Vibrio hannami]|uniref:DUF3450 domain-containing protein n=1 Tax=Vibrio hannami TaxID=2717094 RepID=UPI00240F5296|nr:DUF3450 domain-containing protein [Vibrio hannami]MDG3084903.1 DUF3450 domain-containing protein [Vibrio hannami]
MACAVIVTAQAHSSSLEQSANIERSIIFDAQASQQVVSKSSDIAFELQAEIKALEAELNRLNVYEKHLKEVVENQNQEVKSLDSQLVEIAETRQSIVPLMYEMLDGLSVYISRDMPIRKQARLERVEKLRNLMVQADISDAEKFRRILEAYQIELDYVMKIGTYTGIIEINGMKRQAEQLYVGRLSYLARSTDKQQYWVWSSNSKSWNELDTSFYPELGKAYSVANKLAPPSILQLPLSQAEVSQ